MMEYVQFLHIAFYPINVSLVIDAFSMTRQRYNIAAILTNLQAIQIVVDRERSIWRFSPSTSLPVGKIIFAGALYRIKFEIGMHT